MKKLLIIATLIAITLPSFADAGRVKGYSKKSGKYVSTHVRTKPDGIKSNNYSSRGNFNPYTGKMGNK